MQKVVSEIHSLHANLIAVSPQLQEHSLALKKERNLTFDLLSDPGNKVAQKFGLVYTFPDDLRQVYMTFDINLELFNGDASWTLPMPARFIIDQESTIRYAETDPDYTKRPDPINTIEALKSMKK